MRKTISFVFFCIISAVAWSQEQSHNKNISFCKVSPDGDFIISGSQYEQAVKIWDAKTGMLLKTLHDQRAGGIVFSNKGDFAYLLPGDYDLTKITFPDLKDTTMNLDGKYFSTLYGICANDEDILVNDLKWDAKKKKYNNHFIVLSIADMTKVKWESAPTSVSKRNNTSFAPSANRFLTEIEGEKKEEWQLYEIGTPEPILIIKDKDIVDGNLFLLDPKGQKFYTTGAIVGGAYSIPDLRRLFDLSNFVPSATSFSPGGDTIIYSGYWGAYMINTKTGEKISPVLLPGLYNFDIDRKGRFCVGRESDGTLLTIYDGSDGSKIVDLVDDWKFMNEEDRKKQAAEEDAKWNYNKTVPKNYELMNTSQFVDFYGYIVNLPYMGKESHVYVAAQNKTNKTLNVEIKVIFEVAKGVDNTGRKIYTDGSYFTLRPNEILVGGNALIYIINEKKEDFAKIYVDEVKVTEVP